MGGCSVYNWPPTGAVDVIGCNWKIILHFLLHPVSHIVSVITNLASAMTHTHPLHPIEDKSINVYWLYVQYGAWITGFMCRSVGVITTSWDQRFPQVKKRNVLSVYREWWFNRWNPYPIAFIVWHEVFQSLFVQDANKSVKSSRLLANCFQTGVLIHSLPWLTMCVWSSLVATHHYSLKRLSLGNSLSTAKVSANVSCCAFCTRMTKKWQDPFLLWTLYTPSASLQPWLEAAIDSVLSWCEWNVIVCNV